MTTRQFLKFLKRLSPTQLPIYIIKQLYYLLVEESEQGKYKDKDK